MPAHNCARMRILLTELGGVPDLGRAIRTDCVDVPLTGAITSLEHRAIMGMDCEALTFRQPNLEFTVAPG